MVRASGTQINTGLVGGALLLVIAAVAFWGARGATPAVWLFPRISAAVMGLCGLLLVEEGLRRPERVVLWETREGTRDVVAFAAAAALYALALPRLGFWLAAGLMVGGSSYALGRRRGRWGFVGWLAAGLVLGLALDALFTGAFGVRLPGGRWWDDAPWRPWAL